LAKWKTNNKLNTNYTNSRDATLARAPRRRARCRRNTSRRITRGNEATGQYVRDKSTVELSVRVSLRVGNRPSPPLLPRAWTLLFHAPLQRLQAAPRGDSFAGLFVPRRPVLKSPCQSHDGPYEVLHPQRPSTPSGATSAPPHSCETLHTPTSAPPHPCTLHQPRARQPGVHDSRPARARRPGEHGEVYWVQPRQHVRLQHRGRLAQRQELKQRGDGEWQWLLLALLLSRPRTSARRWWSGRRRHIKREGGDAEEEEEEREGGRTEKERGESVRAARRVWYVCVRARLKWVWRLRLGSAVTLGTCSTSSTRLAARK
jgi:hypothetical protein